MFQKKHLVGILLTTVCKLYLSGADKTLSALCRLSRCFHEIVIRWLYREVRLNPEKPEHLQSLAETISDKRAKHVRKVFVHSGQLSAAPRFLEVAEKLLQKSTLLRAFT